jgi:lysophospholipase L1-like esterase
MTLFFGDSFTSGENNNFNGYVEKLEIKDCKNYGISGTCIGDYSLYPVGNTNLIDILYTKKEEIEKTDTIFLEYGTNDISSIICGYTTLNIVLIDLIKCLDYISQINPKCKIYFLSLGNNLNTFALGQIDYLKDNYFKSISTLLFSSINECISKWIYLYNEFLTYVKNTNVEIIEFPTFNKNELDLDNLHPNDNGYNKIADTIKKYIK